MCVAEVRTCVFKAFVSTTKVFVPSTKVFISSAKWFRVLFERWFRNRPKGIGTRGKQFLQKFISSRDGPEKVQKPDRNERTQENYLISVVYFVQLWGDLTFFHLCLISAPFFRLIPNSINGCSGIIVHLCWNLHMCMFGTFLLNCSHKESLLQPVVFQKQPVFTFLISIFSIWICLWRVVISPLSFLRIRRHKG